MIVLTRNVTVLAFVSALAGCANEVPTFAGFAATPAASLAIAVPTPSVVAATPQPYRKTMSDRVLAAIALERVTGLKPDPARFSE